MKVNFREKLNELASSLKKPLYIVGGYNRNYLIDKSSSPDIDLSAPIMAEEFLRALETVGLQPLQTYKRTGTVVFAIQNQKYEFTSFRKEVYEEGGFHTPKSVEFTTDIELDAKRRDFKANAVYFDLTKDIFVDPLGGIEDIKNKVLDTVDTPEKVFCHDGLRLMRLARFSGELNFTPTSEVMEGAKKYAYNIKDITPERIYDELIKILYSDKKYPFSNKLGHYVGLKILDEIRVLDYILPELTLGRNMVQRADFHDYDVLEHTLKTVAYASEDVRLSALFHDIGKPYCKINYGRYHAHALEGEKIAKEVLERLKAPKKVINEVCFLTLNHMKDINGNMKKSGIRKLLLENIEYAEKLINLMQADFSGCKDDLSEAPSFRKWKEIYRELCSDGTPLNEKELKITSKELMEMGYSGKELGSIKKEMLRLAVENPSFNESEKLKKFALSNLKR